ncbi:MAG: glutamate--tRNA ligase [Alphaproteobacteria bacterium]|jgi:glutamyl-tRNA synthetase
MTRVRFAPSPTGKLHIGNTRIALFNYLIAKKNNGDFILRLDDTDSERSTQEFADGLLKDLEWLGLKHDHTFKQSDRMDRYNEVLQQLKDMGRVYDCYETPEELSLKRKNQIASGKPPVYDRASLKLSEQEKQEKQKKGIKPHWRFLLNEESMSWNDLSRGETKFEAEHLSDPVLVREDGRPLFTLTTVVDDMDEKITHIVRGDDHATNTAVQIQIFKALESHIPEFGHLPLISGKDGDKMSKRLGNGAISSLRENEIEPITLLSALARLGTNFNADGSETMEQLINEFDMDNYSRSMPKFDIEELEKLNSKFINNMDFDIVKDRLPKQANVEVWEIIKSNISKLSQANLWLDVINKDIKTVIEEPDFIKTALSLLPDGEIKKDSWKNWTNIIKAETGRKGKDLFMPLRLAITGQKQGPEIGLLLPLIGREKVIKRLS